MVEPLRWDDDAAFTLMDDAATVQRIARTTPLERLRAARFGDWDAIETLGHLTDVAEVFAVRVRRAQDEDEPHLEAIPEGTLGDARRDVMDLARRLHAAHQEIVAVLQMPGAAERTAVHAEWGRVSAGHLGAYQARHSHEHVRELAAAFPPSA